MDKQSKMKWYCVWGARRESKRRSGQQKDTRHRAARVLQRAARGRLRPANPVDPITLEPPPARSRFLLVTDKAVLAYSPAHLREYLEATHTTADPLTRQELNRVELLRLAHLTGGKPLCIQPAMREELVAQQALVRALENEAGEHIEHLRAAAEAGGWRWKHELSWRLPMLRSALQDCAGQDIEAHNSLLRHSYRALLLDVDKCEDRCDVGSPSVDNSCVASLMRLLVDELLPD